MGKPVKSAKGQAVDFDLLKIKQQMASAPKPTNVKAREDFIDQKFKRRLKKLKNDIVSTAPPVADDPDADQQEESL
jgi:hypothetical protein